MILSASATSGSPMAATDLRLAGATSLWLVCFIRFDLLHFAWALCPRPLRIGAVPPTGVSPLCETVDSVPPPLFRDGRWLSQIPPCAIFAHQAHHTPSRTVAPLPREPQRT